jgi:hypothetical protein
MRSPRPIPRLLLFGGLALLMSAAARGQEPSVETLRAYRAALVLKVVKFTKWPPGSFARDDSPIILSVVGDDRLATHVEGILRELPARGRKTIVQRLRAPGPDANDAQRKQFVAAIQASHVLYVDSALMEQVPQILGDLKGADVLTFGDGAGFAEAGGMLGITWDSQTQRYKIEANLEAINRTGVKVSSHVLDLARIVRGDRK